MVRNERVYKPECFVLDCSSLYEITLDCVSGHSASQTVVVA